MCYRVAVTEGLERIENPPSLAQSVGRARSCCRDVSDEASAQRSFKRPASPRYTLRNPGVAEKAVVLHRPSYAEPVWRVIEVFLGFRVQVFPCPA